MINIFKNMEPVVIPSLGVYPVAMSMYVCSLKDVCYRFIATIFLKLSKMFKYLSAINWVNCTPI